MGELVVVDLDHARKLGKDWLEEGLRSGWVAEDLGSRGREDRKLVGLGVVHGANLEAVDVGLLKIHARFGR